MYEKKKLLILVGAGASVHLGLPSVWAVGELLRKACLQHYPVAADPSRSIYDWLVEEITAYRSAHLKPGFVQEPNFEDVLYTVLQLGVLYPNGHYTASIGAFVDVHQSPDVELFGRSQRLTQYDWRQLGGFLADTIIDAFRDACRTLEPTKSHLIDEMRKFFQALEAEHQVAVATLNYDDAIYRVLPHLETGFDRAAGAFDERRLFERESWGCFLHLHGSVHFDMDSTKSSLHEIVWRDRLRPERRRPQRRLYYGGHGLPSVGHRGQLRQDAADPASPVQVLLLRARSPTQLRRRSTLPAIRFCRPPPQRRLRRVSGRAPSPSGHARQELRDSMNRLIGTIQSRSDGRLEGRDAMNRLKGTYDPGTNETRDEMNRLVGKGNLLSSLITRP